MDPCSCQFGRRGYNQEQDIELIPPQRFKVISWLITHRVVPTGERLGKTGSMSNCKACGVSLEDIAHCLWSCSRAQEVVSIATIVWLATESATWFHGWNGNSRSLKVVHGTVQPSAQGGSFYIHERYVAIWFLVVGLIVWQVWVSKCKESFRNKRTQSVESLMWFSANQ